MAQILWVPIEFSRSSMPSFSLQKRKPPLTFAQLEVSRGISFPSEPPHLEAYGALIGRPLQGLLDHSHSSQSLSLLRRWYLCQGLVTHFWQRWKKQIHCRTPKVFEAEASKRRFPGWRCCCHQRRQFSLITLANCPSYRDQSWSRWMAVTKVALLLPCEK